MVVRATSTSVHRQPIRGRARPAITDKMPIAITGSVLESSNHKYTDRPSAGARGNLVVISGLSSPPEDQSEGSRRARLPAGGSACRPAEFPQRRPGFGGVDGAQGPL